MHLKRQKYLNIDNDKIPLYYIENNTSIPHNITIKLYTNTMRFHFSNTSVSRNFLNLMLFRNIYYWRMNIEEISFKSCFLYPMIRTNNSQLATIRKIIYQSFKHCKFNFVVKIIMWTEIYKSPKKCNFDSRKA